jgi:lactose/L-arabinose transport system substrate-binding protein
MTSSSNHRRWRIRTSALALTVALATGLLTAACSSSSGASTGPATITVWAWGSPAVGLKAAVPAFEKAHPGVKVNVQDVGNPAIDDKTTTGMEAGGVGLPDVMDVGIDYMADYLENFPDGFADLSDFGAGSLAKDFPSGLWASGQNAKGDQYGIPFEVNTNLVFYRTDLFRKAGVNMNDITTWNQLLAAGKKIKTATGADLFAIDKAASQADSADFWQMLARLEGTFFFDKAGDIALSDSGSVAALQFIKEANDAGLVADIPMSAGTTSQLKGQSPVVAIVPGASWMIGSFPQTAPEMQGKWGVRTPPAMKAGGYTAASAGGTFLTVAESSKHQQLAYDFVKFSMANLEGRQLVTKASGLFPSYKPMWNTSAFQQPDAYFGGLNTSKLVINALNQKTPPDYYTKDYAEALKVFDDAQTQVLVSGADPKQALDQAASLLAQQTGRKIAKG